jgi:hypothetical protein
MLDFADKKGEKMCVFFSYTLFLSFILIGVFNSFKNALVITLSVLLIAAMLCCMLIIGSNLLNIVFGKAERIERKINAQKYVGDIYDIFDKECSITTDLLRKYKKHLAKGIHESKGLTGTRILFLMNCISEERERQKKSYRWKRKKH